MTREEEIRKLIDEEMGIDNYGSSDYQVGVCDGVRLADKTMIEKVCEWLSKTLYIHTEVIEDKHWNEIKTFDWITSDYDSVGDFINAFKKAMEE